MVQKKLATICPAPWRQLSVSTSGYGPCCFYKFSHDSYEFPSNLDEMSGLFNSDKMKKIRKRLRENNVKGTPCEKCHERKEKFKINTGFSKEYESSDNYGLFIDSFSRKDISLNYPPPKLGFATSPKCNLRCIMCNSNDSNSTSTVYDEHFIPIHKMLTLF